MAIAGKAAEHGTERFYGTRMASRIYAAALADELELKGDVLDLTVGWGTTSQAYKDTGRRVYGVDINPESKEEGVADETMPSQRWLRNIDSGFCRRFSVVDFEPYGTATDVSDAFFANLWKFRTPLLLVAGCNLRTTIFRQPGIDWIRHLGLPHKEVRKALQEQRIHEVYTQYVHDKVVDSGASFDHYCTISRPDGRKVVVVGLIRRGK